MYYLTLFILFSIFGFIFENIISVFQGSAANSGILIGPWTPIYGIAILIILLINKLFEKIKLKKNTEIILFFIIITIILTLIEFIGGHLIEKILNDELWNYSKLYFNYGKYIALEVSLVWGTIATILNYYVYPKIKPHIKQIPNYITIVLTLIFILDVIIKITKVLQM